MRKLLKRLKKEEKGFTLIELLAVIVILAVIAVIAVPLIGKIIDNTKKDSDVATARQVYDAAKLYVTGELDGDFNGATDTGLTVHLSDLTTKGYLASDTALPSNKETLTVADVEFSATGILVDVTFQTASVTTAKVILAAKVLAGKD
jgi:type IV pilus assembly protein PilA